MDYGYNYVADVNEEYYFLINERDDTARTEKYLDNEIYKDILNKHMQISLQYQCVYNNYKFVYFSKCLYVVDIKSASVPKRIFDVERVYYLNNCIVAIIRRESRYDELIRINVNDLSLESIGTMKIPDVMR